MPSPAARMNEKLPATVEAIRDGWQLTSQGGAVVSGLLAAVAAQLLSYFRDPDTYNKGSSQSTPQGARDVVLTLCYCALLLNIGATISALIILDRLGSLTLTFARGDSKPEVNTFVGTEAQILKHYGAGPRWKWSLWHWLFCFCGGTACLVSLLVIFIWLQEALWVAIATSAISMVAFIPSWLIIFI